MSSSQRRMPSEVKTETAKLTIYSHTGHIVQRYPPGIINITIPKSVIASSIVAIDNAGRVLPFSYIPGLDRTIALTDRSTGDKLNVQVEKGDKVYIGKIISLSDKNVTLLIQDALVNIHKYDTVSVMGSSDLTRPSLLFSQTNTAFTLSYLLDDISWSCVGTALIDDINSKLKLRLTGNIINSTESDITANITLVSGEVYQYRPESESRSMMTSALRRESKSISAQSVKSTQVEDFTRYDVGSRLIRKEDIAELGVKEYSISKIYIHHTDNRKQTTFGYTFLADDFVPSCLVNAYIVDNNRLNTFVGSNEIKESQRGDKVYLMLGNTTQVRCTTQISHTSFNVKDERTAQKYNLPDEWMSGSVEWRVVTEDIKITIKNSNTKDSNLFIKHYIGDKKLIKAGCGYDEKQEPGYLVWNVLVPPGEAHFLCQVITAEAITKY